MSDIPWSAGRWTHPPLTAEVRDTGLVVRAAQGSDAWRHTSYGFVHDSEHALVSSLAVGEAMEVDVVADFHRQFDQAGMFVRAAADHWIKLGVEFADGSLQAGAVVTAPMSDWSVAPVPQWQGRPVTVRASRSSDAIVARIAVDGGPFRLLRVVPFAGSLAAEAGPYVCAPTRAGLEVTVAAWRRVDPDVSLH